MSKDLKVEVTDGSLEISGRKVGKQEEPALGRKHAQGLEEQLEGQGS